MGSILDATNQAIVFTQERIRADFPQEAIAYGRATLNAFSPSSKGYYFSNIDLLPR
ncbi:hypothetical protein HW132_32100 [Brasilonema sp. CT11]|nr:hypothetical protein [Brasilonema sp. CT11]